MFVRIVPDYIVYFIYFIPDQSVMLLTLDINLFSFIFFFPLIYELISFFFIYVIHRLYF